MLVGQLFVAMLSEWVVHTYVHSFGLTIYAQCLPVQTVNYTQQLSSLIQME